MGSGATRRNPGGTVIDFQSRVKGYADMRQMADDNASPFLVDDLVGDSLTLWYGQSEIGKSRFVCGFVAAMLRGEPFLDRKPRDLIDRVMILCADAGGDREYARRLLRPEWAALTEDEGRGLYTIPIPVMEGPKHWGALRHAVDTVEPDLIVLDPLTRAINGDSNQSAPVAEFFTGVQSLGYPTIVVAHSSSKPGENGRHRGSQTPLGHSSIVSSARWRVEMLADWTTGEIGSLKATGNDGPAVEITVRPGPGLTGFTVVSERTRAEAVEQRQARTTERSVQLLAAAKWLVDQHPTATQAEASRLLAEQFPGLSRAANPARATAAALTKRIGVGGYLERSGDRWAVAA